ncbi:growth factor receptor-bound protein 14-like [Sorex fumeus]|uniref:growth factor receptor-bound protein 14-like n=1 Tax=Sorex fumeus TaxID=62283 RepID=UPI0024AE0977|nr:growth factor receptor-bound protein 14-like [Sorex fumeus]
MTTSLRDGQSAAGRAAARRSPLAAQVCGAAQGRGDARDPRAGPRAARAGRDPRLRGGRQVGSPRGRGSVRAGPAPRGAGGGPRG